MALNSIKKTFTSCYIPRRNSSVELAQDSMINETDEYEIAKNTLSERFAHSRHLPPHRFLRNTIKLQYLDVLPRPATSRRQKINKNVNPK